MEKTPYSQSFAGVILLIAGLTAFYLGYEVIRGIFIPLLFGAIFAVVFYPLCNWLEKRLHSRVISSVICCLLLVSFFILLFSFALYLAVGEVMSVTQLFTNSIDIERIDFWTDQEQVESLVEEAIVSINRFAENIPFVDAGSVSGILSEALKSIPQFIQTVSSSFISILKIGLDSAARLIINLVIFFISFFFLLIDGGKFVKYTFSLLPINALHERQIIKRFTGLCFSWMVVSVLLAIIQGTLAGVGYAIIGVPSALVWGIVSIFAAFIPFIGVSLVWGIIGIVYLMIGKYWSALFIILWGMFLVGTIDNFLRPFLLRGGVKIHPLILFIAVIGGFYAYNIPGLIIGPIIIVFISTLIYIYELEFGEALYEFHHRDRRRVRSKE